MTDEELLYGCPGATYHSLLNLTQPPRPTPPDTMTRQRRRAAERAARKR